VVDVAIVSAITSAVVSGTSVATPFVVKKLHQRADAKTLRERYPLHEKIKDCSCDSYYQDLDGRCVACDGTRELHSVLCTPSLREATARGLAQGSREAPPLAPEPEGEDPLWMDVIGIPMDLWIKACPYGLPMDHAFFADLQRRRDDGDFERGPVLLTHPKKPPVKELEQPRPGTQQFEDALQEAEAKYRLAKTYLNALPGVHCPFCSSYAIHVAHDGEVLCDTCGVTSPSTRQLDKHEQAMERHLQQVMAASLLPWPDQIGFAATPQRAISSPMPDEPYPADVAFPLTAWSEPEPEGTVPTCPYCVGRGVRQW
jgi:hypothetical protein